MDRVSPKVLALLGALTLVWGTNWPLFRIALDELPVWTFRTVVMCVAVLMLTAILAIRGESFAVPKGKWPALIAAAAMNIGIWNIATSLAVLYIPSGHASVLAYTMPLWVALMGFIVFGQSDVFMDMVRQGYRPVYRPKVFDFREIVDMHGEIAQKVLVVGPDGKPVTAIYPMTRLPDGSWRINGCYLLAPDEHQA